MQGPWPALTSSTCSGPTCQPALCLKVRGANSHPQHGAQRTEAQIKDSATSYLPVCFAFDLAPALLYYYKAYNYSILSEILLSIDVMINNIILQHTIVTNISILTTITIVCVTMLCPFMHWAFHSFYHLCESGTIHNNSSNSSKP